MECVGPPSKGFDMRHFVLVGLFATILAGVGVHWLTRQTQPEAVVVEVGRSHRAAFLKSLWSPVAEPKAEPESILFGRREEAVVEPILVLPDAPLAEPPVLSITEELPAPAPTRDAHVRPEPGRRWMPYAEEDLKLADERRAHWNRMVAQSAAEERLSVEETSEPPLANPERKSP